MRAASGCGNPCFLKLFERFIAGSRKKPILRCQQNLEMATISYDFVANETFVPESSEVIDPEFDYVSAQVCWQNKNQLWVARVDEITGDIIMSTSVLLDSSLAPISRNGVGTRNGPEWLLTSTGSEILYTRATTSDPSSWEVWSAKWTEERWQTRSLVSGSSPIGSTNGNANPRFLYRLTDPKGARESNPLLVYDYNTGGTQVVTESGTLGARWVNQESDQIVYASNVGTVSQIFIYDVNTRQTEQITFGSLDLSGPFIWRAPELNNSLVMLAVERKAGASTGIVIYRQNSNRSWSELLKIKPPSEDPWIYSAEPNVYDGSSVISLVTKDILTPAGLGEIWLAAPFTKKGPFLRKISGPEEYARNDPESYPTKQGLTFYYNASPLDAGIANVLVQSSTGILPSSSSTIAAPNDPFSRISSSRLTLNVGSPINERDYQLFLLTN